MECQRGLAMRKRCPSVCLSNACICDKTEERSVQIFIPYERLFSLVYWKEEWLKGDPFYLKFWVNRPHGIKIADSEPIFARSASAVTPSEKSSISTISKSTMRFPMSLRWSSYVAPNGCFQCKIALRLKKVCYNVSLCENCQRQSYKRFTGLTIHAKMIGEGRPDVPLYAKIWRLNPPADFFLFSPVAPSKKSSINTNRNSTTRFTTNLTWTSYVAPKPSKGWLKKRKVSKIWTISCDNSETVRDRMSVSTNH